MGKKQKTVDSDVVDRPSNASIVCEGELRNENVSVKPTDSNFQSSSKTEVCFESSVRFERYSFSSPETIQMFENIKPGFGERVFERLEKEQDFNIEKQRALLEASKVQAEREYKTKLLGQILVAGRSRSSVA